MKDALAIHRWLLAHQIHHEIVRLSRPLTCAGELPEVLGVPAETCAGVSVFEVSAAPSSATSLPAPAAARPPARPGRTPPAPPTTPGDRRPVAVISAVDTSPTSGAVGAVLRACQVRPAPSFLVNAATDYADRLVCPLLLPDELMVLLDRRLVEQLYPDQFVHTTTGERRTALRLRAVHLFRLVSAEPVDFAAPHRRRLVTLASPTGTA